MRRALSLSLLIALVLAPLPARAQSPVLFWASVGGALNGHAMDDVNANLQALNVGFEDIEVGASVAGSFGIRFNSNIDVGLNFERLVALSKVGDDNASITYDVSANAVYGSLDVSFPLGSSVDLALGAGVGVVVCDGEISFDVANILAAKGKIDGSGPLLLGRAFLKIPLGENIEILPGIVLRLAKATGVELEGVPMLNADGSALEIDYTGVGFTLAARVLFGL